MSDILPLTLRQLLSGTATYVVPMYQRNYAWDEPEIAQLIQDIADTAASDEHCPYYLGTLVVATSPGAPNHFETIDGQQRLTTLCLLAAYLKHTARRHRLGDFARDLRMPLDFHSRKKSAATITRLFESPPDEVGADTEMDAGILNGYRQIERAFPGIVGDANAPRFARFFLGRVQIVRVPVPEQTDLNRYFETMNSRGEQLEKHEVLKARLLGVLPDADRHAFNTVWDACANMGRYVQTCFTKDTRGTLFGESWDRLAIADFDALRRALPAVQSIIGGDDTLDAILNGSSATRTEQEGKEPPPERFTSVINFPGFLLHVLRLQHPEATVPLDDKKLLPLFQEHILNRPTRADLARNFAVLLLKCRCLFDSFVIKREDTSETWSLKQLKRSKESASYVNTFGPTDEVDDENRRPLMLLAALHVSAPAPNYKYWLHAALRHLASAPWPINGAHYREHMEKVAEAFAFRHYLALPGTPNGFDEIIRNLKQWDMQPGEYPPEYLNEALSYHRVSAFIFNYLDYLLWLRHRANDPKVKHFKFGIRSSVEHHLAQHSLIQVPGAEPYLHTFGNLCLLTPSKNSLLNASSPEEKKKYYTAKDAIDSIKQKLMMDVSAWDAQAILDHGRSMIEVLRGGPCRH